MAYRDSAAGDEVRFTDEQRQWIRASGVTEAKVRTNLAGRDAHPIATRVRQDRAGQAMLWTGLAFTGLGGFAAFSSASLLSAVAIVPGILVAGAAVHRLQDTEVGPFSIDIVVVLPKFDVRVVNGVPETHLVTDGAESLLWPRPLIALADRLSENALLRVGIVKRNEWRYISWAFPV